ncbi:hypothetical protein GCM10010515_42300 [Streptomyces fructofermentans]|uniref:Uncharacterized protein n=1 Tax=Streptomyces fructofermentans TaxID=152141 RepID=A0A918KNX8_9ACTN|nr:hypothetical protein GCM10010515_42300 [Streptomyces fructofermentans]
MANLPWDSGVSAAAAGAWAGMATSAAMAAKAIPKDLSLMRALRSDDAGRGVRVAHGRGAPLTGLLREGVLKNRTAPVGEEGEWLTALLTSGVDLSHEAIGRQPLGRVFFTSLRGDPGNSRDPHAR